MWGRGVVSEHPGDNWSLEVTVLQIFAEKLSPVCSILLTRFMQFPLERLIEAQKLFFDCP